jgi:hypothetical protein
MIRRALANFVLTFSLLLAQQGGFAHELGHLSQSSQTDKRTPNTKLCEGCLAYSQLGSGAVPQASSSPSLCVAVARFLPLPIAPLAWRSLRPNSRAPPVLA